MKKVLKGQCSTLTTSKDGETKLESEYYNIKVNCQNKDMAIQLRSSLTYLALADIDFDNTYEQLISILFKALYKAKNEKDLEDIESFLILVKGHNTEIDYFIDHFNEIVQNNGPDILKMEDETKQDLIDDLDRKRKSSKENKLEKIINKKELLDMQVDELRNKPMKNPDEYYTLLRDYEELGRELETIIESTNNESNKRLAKEIEKEIEKTCEQLNKSYQILNEIEEKVQYM